MNINTHGEISVEFIPNIKLTLPIFLSLRILWMNFCSTPVLTIASQYRLGEEISERVTATSLFKFRGEIRLVSRFKRISFPRSMKNWRCIDALECIAFYQRECNCIITIIYILYNVIYNIIYYIIYIQ